MSNDIYGVESPPSHPQQPPPHQQTYTAGPSYYPAYYQSPPRSDGCGTYLFRAFMTFIVLSVCCFFFVCLVVGVMMVLAESMEKITAKDSSLAEKFVSGNKDATQKVAILTVEGVISDSTEEGFIPKQIKRILDDEEVKAVVLRIDSPGGTMAGSDYCLHLLKEMKEERDIPIVVSMGSVAASGGYYVAMVGDEIYAEPSTITGSIGVIVPLFKGVELCQKIGVESTPVVSGPHKAMGSFSKPMSEEEEKIWQALVDDSFGRFKQVIRDGRDVFARDPEKLDRLATGQIYTATEAKGNGLIDELGYLDTAVEAAMERAGLTENNAKTIRYKSKKKFIDTLLESRAGDKLLRVETIVDLTTPRVYLLCPQVVPLR